MQMLYLGRAPRTKETLPDFLKWRRVTRHPLVFCGLTGSQRTPGNGASHFQILSSTLDYHRMLQSPTQFIQIMKMPSVQRFNHKTYTGLSKRLYRTNFDSNKTLRASPIR